MKKCPHRGQVTGGKQDALALTGVDGIIPKEFGW